MVFEHQTGIVDNFNATVDVNRPPALLTKTFLFDNLVRGLPFIQTIQNS